MASRPRRRSTPKQSAAVEKKIAVMSSNRRACAGSSCLTAVGNATAYTALAAASAAAAAVASGDCGVAAATAATASASAGAAANVRHSAPAIFHNLCCILNPAYTCF